MKKQTFSRFVSKWRSIRSASVSYFILHTSYFLLLLLAGCGKPEEPHQCVERFFHRIAKGDFEKAYEGAAYAFQAQTSLANFRAVSLELGLEKNKGFKPGDILQLFGSAAVYGDVALADGKALPVRVEVVRESGGWQVSSVQGKAGGEERDYFSLIGKGIAFTPPANRELPAHKELVRLARDSVMMFNAAIAREDFADFFSGISAAWQRQATEGQFQRAFQPFIDAKVDLSDARGMEPVFDEPPNINANGTLLLEGHFKTRPLRIVFKLQFDYEYPDWKLSGLQVQLKE